MSAYGIGPYSVVLVLACNVPSPVLLQSALACAPEAQSDVTCVTMASDCVSSLTTINSLLETTLTWLHEAKDKFNNMKPVADNVDAVKVQFHEHEVCSC